MPSLSSQNSRPVEPVQRPETACVRAMPAPSTKRKAAVPDAAIKEKDSHLASRQNPSISSLLITALRFVPSSARGQAWKALGYSETERTAFALAKATLDPLTALKQLPLLALANESSRREVASVMIKKIPEEVAMSLGRIGISDKKFQFECAQAAVSPKITHLFYPWWQSNPKLPTQLGAMNFPEKEKVALLKNVIESRIEELPAYSKALRVSQVDSRYQISVAWTESYGPVKSLHGSPRLGFPLSRDWLPDERMRANLVKLIAAKSPRYALEFVKAAGIESPDFLREIAQSAASSSGKFDYKALPALGILDEKSLIDIYERGARADPQHAVSSLRESGIKDPEAIGRIVKIAADNLQNAVGTVEPFARTVKILLDPQDRTVLREVGFSLARFGWRVAYDLEGFGICTREDKIRFASFAAYHSGPPEVEMLEALGLGAPEDVVRVLVAAAKSHATMVVLRMTNEYLQLRPEHQHAVLGAVASQSPVGVSAVVRWAHFFEGQVLSEVIAPVMSMMQSVWSETRASYSVKFIENVVAGLVREGVKLGLAEPSKGVHEPPLNQMTRVLRAFEARFPHIPTGIDRLAVDGSGLSEEAALLLVASSVATAQNVREGDQPHKPLALVAGLYGLEDQPLGPRDTRKVLELLRSIYEGDNDTVPQMGALVDIAPEVWRTNFAGALECVLGRAALYSVNPDAPIERMRITNANLAEQRRALGMELDGALRDRLRLSSVGGTLELAEKWGDLSPITVLLGRFARSHPYEIPALRDVVERVLDGSFHDYRYDPTRGQLAGFTPEMIEKWRENPHRLTLCRAGESSDITRERSLAEAQQNYSQLLAHISQVEEVGVVSSQSSLEQAQYLARSKQDAFAREYKQIEKDNPGSSWAHVVSSVGLLLKEGDREGVVMFLRNFATIRARVGEHYPPEVRQQLSEDLNALSEAVKERSVDKSKGYLVFTTLTDDPKLLMMVGDLVNTSSCQNYRTGSVVETLLGYVMDGNIKASLSFVVAEGNVRNLFKIPQKDSFDPSRFTVSFDAPKLLLTLTDPEGQSHTIPLGKAIRRRILRVGQGMDDAVPVMFAERPYQILHAVTAKVEAEEAALLQTVETKCGFGVAQGDVEFPASENPAGVYSDYGRGAMRGEYILKLVPGLEEAPMPALNELL